MWLKFALIVLVVCVFHSEPVPVSYANEECSQMTSGLFAANVAHSVHSLTVSDLQLFDPDVTRFNFVPTISLNRSEPLKILRHAPAYVEADDAMFRGHGMKLLNRVLSHADDPNWDIAGYDILERIVHAFHMQEVWLQARHIYKHQLATEPPSPELCDCALDVEKNGIMQHLQRNALKMRRSELDSSLQDQTTSDENNQSFENSRHRRRRNRRAYEEEIWAVGDYFGRRHRRRELVNDRQSESDVIQPEKQIHEVRFRQLTEHIKITGSASWQSWKMQMKFLSAAGMQQMYEDTALFLYCALRKARNTIHQDLAF